MMVAEALAKSRIPSNSSPNSSHTRDVQSVFSLEITHEQVESWYFCMKFGSFPTFRIDAWHFIIDWEEFT